MCIVKTFKKIDKRRVDLNKRVSTVKPRNLRPRSLRTLQICGLYFVLTPSNLLSNFRKSVHFSFRILQNMCSKLL